MKAALATVVWTGMLTGCGGVNASTLTHPPTSLGFPMYVTIPGTTAASGKLLRLDSPAGADSATTPVEVATGLDFPAAVAVNRDGVVYFTERPSETTGRIRRFLAPGTPPETVVTGLSDPQGLAIDSAGKMYVSEQATGAISLVNSDGTLEPIVLDLSGPRSLSTDENDNLYVTEATSGTVSKLIPDGTKQVIATGLKNPVAVSPGLVGNTFYLVANTGLGDGSAMKVSSGNTEEYLSRLINPKSLVFEDSTILYIAEGAPAFRIIKYSTVSAVRTETARFTGEPHSIAFKPLN